MAKKILIVVAAFVVLFIGFLVYASRVSSEVKVERAFDAPVAKVWHLWNDPEAIKNWWSPKDFTAPIIQNDIKTGGRFLFSMKAPDGKMFWNSGTYTEVVLHQKIVSQMAFSDENGKAVPASTYGLPGQWPDEVKVTVEFTDVGGQTLVRVHEVGIPLIMKLFAAMGWEQQFDKFQNLVAR